MTDRRAAFDEEGLPWLEAVADEDGPQGVSARKMLAALAMVGLAVALVAATMFVIGRSNAGPTSGPAELIKADLRPYKIKPTDPGGLDVAGDSETAFATSAGGDTDAQIDMNAVTEAPVARPETKPKSFPANETREPVVPTGEKTVPVPVAVPEAAPSGGAGTVIQLGAFSSGTKAEAAWKALTARFGALGAMSKIITPVSGSSLFRLRAGAASPADAKAMCQSLRVAGENCVVIG
ncbi:SPOR domain-containing protein [Sphingomonas sp. RB1R13]|uniref:SPOR domain-containing protein n=1 Tax=Sphingomonas sp. RB1R13 TaxID=3096159 RepID=UPI002FC9444B